LHLIDFVAVKAVKVIDSWHRNDVSGELLNGWTHWAENKGGITSLSSVTPRFHRSIILVGNTCPYCAAKSSESSRGTCRPMRRHDIDRRIRSNFQSISIVTVQNPRQIAQKFLIGRFEIISESVLAIIFYVGERKIGRFSLLGI
jgi:hypothetical protein